MVRMCWKSVQKKRQSNTRNSAMMIGILSYVFTAPAMESLCMSRRREWLNLQRDTPSKRTQMQSQVPAAFIEYLLLSDRHKIILKLWRSYGSAVIVNDRLIFCG
eukprot:1084771_1